MTGYITVNGISSRDFDVVLSDAYVYGKPERDVQTIQIPGRSGDLIIDNNRYKNINFSYPCAIISNFDTNYTAFINFLLSQKGYMRIEDSFHPDEYVLAQYTGETNVSHVKKDRAGTFRLTFNRKPQRYLKAGEEPLPDFTSSGQIMNNGSMTALPLVRAYGTGSVSIGEQTITINSLATGASYTDIDCDIQDAYYELTNCNGNITMNTGKFFELKPGMNGVSLGSGISKVVITPRWFRL